MFSHSLKPKDLVGMPWRLAFALQADGWWLRSAITWCLSGGTRVYARTQKGDMPTTIKDLVRLRPETVQLWNGQKWTRVLGWGETPRPEAPAEIVLRSGERITCTPNHQWPTTRGNVKAGDLVVGDEVRTTRLPEPSLVDAPGNLPDAEIGWLVGLYLAEGFFSGPTSFKLSCHAREVELWLPRLRDIAAGYGGVASAHTGPGKSAVIEVSGRVLRAIVETYVSGIGSHGKHLSVACWRRSNFFLLSMLNGYLVGDGNYDEKNGRWRLNFTRNYELEASLRTLCARVGASIRLRPRVARCEGRDFQCFRGEVRLNQRKPNGQSDGEIVELRVGRARKFWDIAVEDEPHLFALASGVLTHNCKRAPMPESVTDRPTTATDDLPPQPQRDLLL